MAAQPGFQDQTGAGPSNSAGSISTGAPQAHPNGSQWPNASSLPNETLANGSTSQASAPQTQADVPNFKNHPPFSFEGPSDRKSKSVQSCTECRRRKIKCDRVFPCGPCKIRNEPDVCEEYIKTKVSEPSGYTLVSDFRLLAKRTEKLENFLQAMYGESKSVSDAVAQNIMESEQYNQDLTIDNGLQDNLGWDDNFQPSFANETTQINIPHLPQTSLPPLPPQQSTFVSQPEDMASFQPPVYPFNEDLMPGPSSLPLDVSSEPSKQSQPHEFQQKSALSGSRSSSPSDTDHEAALALEDMALNRHHARLKTIFAGTPAYSYRHLPPPSLGPLVSLQSVLSDWHRTPVLLPDLRSLRALASDFLNKYLWIQRCLHVPSFTHELETFLTSAAERGGDIYFEPKFVSFASLLFAACATSIHFARDDDCLRYGVAPGTQSTACNHWVDAALTLLHKAEWLQRHDVLALQTVLVLGPILSATDRGEMHWAMTGSAIKVAQAMNFCNLVAESIYEEKASQHPRAPHSNVKSPLPLAREVGRRIWAHLVEVDWLFASEHNFAYSVHPTQNRTAEVSNVNDSDLTMATTLRPLPEHIWTESSYTIWKDRMIHPYREFLDGCLTPSKSALSLIQQCDTKLNKLACDLPSFYQLHTDLAAMFPNPEIQNQVRVERIAIQSGLHTRLLRVHRTVLRRAYRNHKYDSSREACIRSSSTLLALAEDWLTSNMVIAGWWPVVYGVFSASVVLFITMCRNDRLVEAHESRIIRAIQIIRSLPGPVSAKRGHMASMLEKLLDGRRKKLSSTASAPIVPSKRKHYADPEPATKETPLEDQMDRFVERLVAKTPNSTGNYSGEQRSDQGSFVDTSFTAGDGLNTFDFNFDFGNYGDPFADIMRMTEASLGGNTIVPSQTLWPWD